jgi:hypothetical protein
VVGKRTRRQRASGAWGTDEAFQGHGHSRDGAEWGLGIGFHVCTEGVMWHVMGEKRSGLVNVRLV